ncbi:GRIP domain-containing protein [Schizosaccharomyces cryophilus OY26]|uniref:GRIP domain-containing protein n=1 Tax=Schizosaccharomyces cryophilus (strain OY26 / ATCC MYA-4695 / CBS 11777 / NBRC 106824 / NRRL Y48691) TaxID=653667 RepID=S9W329_SCHCR|nr:GRIP domain-containing protein [Schizosaccharomyces cryophilus OY26]EPY52350.1 GRIP domain-containing protein [Schizosaccharomyces cryophilus OY26]
MLITNKGFLKRGFEPKHNSHMNNIHQRMLGRLKDQFNLTLVQGQEEAKNRRRQLQEIHQQHIGSTENSSGHYGTEDLVILQSELADLRLTIDRFQTVLQEKTPLSSISDIEGFLEFLDNLEHRYEISIREVKRLSNELQEADTLLKTSRQEFEEKFKCLKEKFSSEIARLSSSESKNQSDDKAVSLSKVEDYFSLLPQSSTPKEGSVPPETTITTNRSSAKKKKRKIKKNQKERHADENPGLVQENLNFSQSITGNASPEEQENVQNNRLSSVEAYLQLSNISIPSTPSPTLTKAEDVFLQLPSIPFKKDEALPTIVESLRKELEAAEKKLKTESANFHNKEETHRNNIFVLNSSIESLQKEVEECRKNLLWAETSCDSLREEKQQLLERLSNNDDLTNKLLQSRSEAQKNLKLSQEKLVHTSKQLEIAHGKEKSILREVDVLQKDNEEKMNVISELNKKLVFLTEQSNEYSRQIHENKEATQTKQEEFEEVYKLLLDQTRDCQKLRGLVEQLEIDRGNSQNAAELRIHQLTEEYNIALQEKNSVLSELEAKYQVTMSELERLKLKDAELTQQNQVLSDGIQKIKLDKSNPGNGQHLQMEGTLRTLEAENKSLAAALDESTARYEHLQKSFKVMFGQHRRKQSQGNLSDRSSSISLSRASVDQQNSNTLVDKEYTRNILFQFLEQRERRTEIVNLLSILLELSDEQKEKLLSIKY